MSSTRSTRRFWPSVIAELMTREFCELLDGIEQEVAALATAREGSSRRDGRQDGSVRRADDASPVAYCLQLTVQAFVLPVGTDHR